MAACFVAPNVVDLEDFKAFAKPRKPVGLHKRNGGWCPCLFHLMPAHRKYAIAYTRNLPKGWPANDLYRLPNSVFNDDNIHTIPTDFDMMVLRATYAPNCAAE